VSEQYKLCINCQHFRLTPQPTCWHEKNLKPLPPMISLVTGEPLAVMPKQEFNITNLEIMRSGGGYCGEQGLWYAPKHLSGMVSDANKGEAA